MEKLYQYLWKSRMFGRTLCDADGGSVEVVDPGHLNTDAGPDFFNAKVKLGGRLWAGNVEIHVKASDWFRHGHQSDPAYDNIVLHVVGVSDRRVTRSDGSLIPQVEVRMPEDFFRTFSALSSSKQDLRCAPHIAALPGLIVTDWLETLSIERIQSKAQKVLDILDACGGDWEQTAFIIFSRALGFGLNGDPFEMLARSLPLKLLHHHSDNLFQIEALLFGQAAMLDSSLHILDEYYQMLCREYYFLARKYGIRPMKPGLWKYSRTRPQNFPHRRIAYLAKACEGGFSLFSEIVKNCGNEEALRKKLTFMLEGYWHNHFSWDTDARAQSDSLSAASITLLLINVAAPIIYACGAMRGDPELSERGLDLLESLPAESNGITRGWGQLGLRSENALRSQALIHLRKEYCDKRKCFYCRFGSHLLRKSASETGKDDGKERLKVI